MKVNVDRIAYAAWTRLNNTHASGPLSITQFTNAIYDPIHPVAGSFTKDGTWSDYYNPEIEALIAEANRTADVRKRDEVFKKVGKVLHDDAAAFFLTELYYVFAKKQSLDWEIQTGSGFLNFRQVGWR